MQPWRHAFLVKLAQEEAASRCSDSANYTMSLDGLPRKTGIRHSVRLDYPGFFLFGLNSSTMPGHDKAG